MFQPNVLFSDNSNYPKSRKAQLDKLIIVIKSLINSTLLAEEEGDTATRLGRPKGEKGESLSKLIHRVPSIEGDTATRLGSLILKEKKQKINRKNAPNKLSIKFLKTRR